MVALWFSTEKLIEDDCGVVWIFIPEAKHIINDEEKKQDIFTRQATKVFSPNHISERITAQQGWFTCHKITTDNRILTLESNTKYKSKLKKLKINNAIFPEMRIMLDTMGINANTVFPDLEGLSRYLTWKHTKVDVYPTREV